jgi:hypothetical protein
VGIRPSTLALCVLAVSSHAFAQQPPATPRLNIRTLARVIASAGVEGHFLDPICIEDVAFEPAESGLYTYALVRAAHASDHPMVLDAGGLLAPNGVLRFAAENDPELLADTVAALGYRALALGESELAAPRDSLLSVLRALRGRRVPAIASNLRCRAEAHALCDAVVDSSDGISMHEVAGSRMAVLALLDDSTLDRVAPELAVGLRIEPVRDALARDVREAHARGADLVVAVLDVSVDDALALAADLPDDARPDLALLAGAGGRLLFARPTAGLPTIVAPPLGDAVEVVVREDSELRTEISMVAQPLAMRGISAGEPILALADGLGDAYCDAWGQTLVGGLLARPIDAVGVANLAADIARDRAHADVAALNLSAIDGAWIPAHPDSLTASDVYVAIQYDEPLVVAEVSRGWIEALARHAPERGLITPGLTWDGTNARVRGRTLVTRATYRVVTLRFLAEGGDDALEELEPGAASPVWQPVGEDTLRSVVLDALSRRSFEDPRDVRAPPGDAPEWIMTGGVDGAFAGSSISNPAAYDTSLLNRASTLTLGVETSLGALATAPDWSWETTLIGRYRTQWTPSVTPAVAGAFTEAVDQLQLRSTGSWRGIRGLVHSQEWYVPDPFIEAFVETEITRPDTRTFHWFLVRPLAGVRFAITPELEVKLDVGFQVQALQPNAEVEGGFGAVVQLRPWDLLRSGDQHTTVSTTLDFFWSDPGDRNFWQLRGQLDAVIDLAGPLALTFGARLYLQQDRGQDLGAAIDATAGLRVSGLARLVGP